MVMEVNNNRDRNSKIKWILFIVGIAVLIILILNTTFYSEIELISEIDKECMKFIHLNSQYGKVYGNLSEEQKAFILDNCV